MSSAFQPWDNPMGTAGFEFVNMPRRTRRAAQVFELLGFKAIAKHRHKDVTLYRQGGVNFLINAEPDSFAQRFARLHGPSICAIGFRVQDAAKAQARTGTGRLGLRLAQRPDGAEHSRHQGIGDSLIYLVDRWAGKEGHGGIGDISIYDVDFVPLDVENAQADLNHRGAGLTLVDHLTHNVHKGRMAEWSEFYERLFNFREVRYFDIEGKVTGVKSKAMTSPCGNIRIPINEEGTDEKGQIQEYLTCTAAKASSISPWRPTISTARSKRCARTAWCSWIRPRPTTSCWTAACRTMAKTCHACKRTAFCSTAPPAAACCCRSSPRTRSARSSSRSSSAEGNDGFGEGNFKALFESIELDQMRRGVLKTVE